MQAAAAGAQVMAGITNQGATCHLSATLQMLARLDQVCDALNSTPPGGVVHDMRDVAIALKNIFLLLRLHRDPVSTVSLTRALGWTEANVHQQQDAHETFMVHLGASFD
eukprot:TRINITY_DN4494_c0_g1_i4.p1 TRINITY_DN4494_c0_g1~~TRINITY_DN4494_c0_g1_i4.p1  ORF type:complete len:109 (+),score=28.73 TRINITY_DN4494_c0_g1_i4:185-511(+)